MPCFSSRSIVAEPIRIAIPNAIQPIADMKSPRKPATFAASVGDDAGAARSGEDIGIIQRGSGSVGRRANSASPFAGDLRDAHQGLGMPTVSGETLALPESNSSQALACTAGNTAFCGGTPAAVSHN